MKKISIVIVVLLVSLTAAAQQPMKNPEQKKNTEEPSDKKEDEPEKQKPEKAPFWSKVRVGGNAWASFGDFTYVLLQPTIGYQATERLLVGTSGTYIYQSQQVPTSSGGTFKLSSSLYGGSILARYNIISGLFANAEYEALNYDFYDPAVYNTNRRWVGSALVGGGYSSGDMGSFRGPYLLVLYNLNQTIYSPYPSPLIIRAGILF